MRWVYEEGEGVRRDGEVERLVLVYAVYTMLGLLMAVLTSDERNLT